MSITVILTAVACATIAFTIAAMQAALGARIGTDHPGHVFLVRAIRANRYRLFVRIPRLLNNAVVAALPLYLHWLFAHVRDRWMSWAERLLNPIISAFHIMVFALLTTLAHGATERWQLGVIACFAFTPQFFHALSARNFGLSARTIGLLLLTGSLACAFQAGSHAGVAWWLAAVMLAYLVFAFSTFAAQALVILSVILAALFLRPEPIAATLFGLVVFLAVHPRYSLGYLRHTIGFIRAYSTELAPLYILARRPSLWRDLVRDIWQRIATDCRTGLRYAYENGVLIVVFCNPLLFLAIAQPFQERAADSFLRFAFEVAASGGLAALATSFRATRFLGEPERYVEAVAPWITLAGTMVLYKLGGEGAVFACAVLFLIAALVQLGMTRVLVRFITAKSIDVPAIERAIATFSSGPVRLASNNEHLTKRFMYNDWDFAYCIAVGTGYCGMRISDAFSVFPALRPDAFARIVETYRINICVLDRAIGESVFSGTPAALKSIARLHESEDTIAYGLTWHDEPQVAAASSA